MNIDEQRFINTASVLHQLRESLPECQVIFSHFTDTLQSVRLIVITHDKLHLRVNLDTMSCVILEKHKTKLKFACLRDFVDFCKVSKS